MITAGQDTSTGRLAATASEKEYVGNSWIPIRGLSSDEAKALAVFVNSTVGRLQLMRNAGKKLAFPNYSTGQVGRIRVPDVKNTSVRNRLKACFEETRAQKVPQYRSGECDIRRRWDENVAQVMNLEFEYLSHLRNLLHNEPHVRGIGYQQYKDETD